MPVGLEVEFDRSKFSSLLHTCSKLAKPSEIDKAINRAAKRAADTAKAETVRQLSSEYTLPAKEIRGTIFARNNKGGDVGAVMNLESSPIPLTKFKGVTPKEAMPPARGPVQVKVKKSGGATFKQAFIAKMKNGAAGVYERKTETSLPIEQHFGPATTGMFKANETVNQAVINLAGETLNKRVIHELERLMYG